MREQRSKEEIIEVMSEFLYRLGNALIEMSITMKKRGISLDKAMLVRMLDDLKRDFFEETILEDLFFTRDLFPNKESIIRFMGDYYKERIPKSWTRPRITRHAMNVVNRRGGLERFKEFISRRESRRPVEKITVDLHEIELEEIEREFRDTTKYPDVESIKNALPSGFRKLLKGITNREYAIKKITDEIGRLRSVGKILKM